MKRCPFMTNDQYPLKKFGATSALAAVALISSVSNASAVLLVDPAGGIVTASASTGPANKNDGTYQAVYAPNGSFFGTFLPGTQPTISLNGHFYYGPGDGDGDWHLGNLGSTGMSRIAPLWHDFRLGSTGQVIEEVAATYYAVTWKNMESEEVTGAYATFQAIFFESTTTLYGQLFQAGDIAFAYGDIGAYELVNEVVVGLEAGSSYAAIPGSEPYFGWSAYSAFGDFPVGTGEYLHFRPNGANGYSATISPIPEPSGLLLGSLGLLALARRKRA